MIDPKVFTALLLTSMGAAGTALGAFMVVLHPKMQFKRLGIFQGLAGGLMLSISVFDLFQESQEAVGTLWANVWFFAGVIFFAAVVAIIPEPDATHFVIPDDDEDDEPDSAPGGGHGANQEASGTSTAVAAKTAPRKRATGAAAAATEQQQAASEADPSDQGKSGKARRRAAKRRVLMSGLITAIGIALHNFPEGVAVFLASMKSTGLGVSIACAIALHNIPEGVAVALPVYFATGSRWQGFKYAFVSGLAEPAAVLVLGLLFPTNLSQSLVDCLLAAVGGIMAFLALSELLPLAIEHAGRQQAVAALFVGMALMSANLYVLQHHLGHSHGDHGHDHAHGHGDDHHHHAH